MTALNPITSRSLSLSCAPTHSLTYTATAPGARMVVASEVYVISRRFIRQMAVKWGIVLWPQLAPRKQKRHWLTLLGVARSSCFVPVRSFVAHTRPINKAKLWLYFRLRRSLRKSDTQLVLYIIAREGSESEGALIEIINWYRWICCRNGITSAFQYMLWCKQMQSMSDYHVGLFVLYTSGYQSVGWGHKHLVWVPIFSNYK